MFEHTSIRLPTIYVTTRDRNRLYALLATQIRFIPDAVRAELERELSRAVVCAEDEIPPDVVTMNSRALFRADLGAEPQSRTLIYDDGHSILGGTVSVTTATGMALLGLREGSRMPYANIDGERRVLVLERVAYQPEACGRAGVDPYRPWPKPPAQSGTVSVLRQPPRRRGESPDDSGPGAA